MSTTVHCPECHAPLELPDSIPPGKRLQCPDCGAAFSPPDEADRAGGLKTEPARPDGRAPVATAAPRRRPRRNPEEFERDGPVPRRGGGAGVLIAAVVIIVVLLIGAGGAVLLGYERASVQVEPAQMAPPPMAAPGMMKGAGGPMVGMPGAGGAMMGFPPQVGAPAPEIDGDDLDGKPMKLSDFRGKVVVVAFWGDWSPTCPPAYPYLKNLGNRMKDEPFVLLGVNCDDTKEQAQKVTKDQKLGLRSWFDGGNRNFGPVLERYAVNMLPTCFIIDKNGTLQQRIDGAPNEFNFDAQVDRVMALGDVRPANAPARWTASSTAFSHLGDGVPVGPYVIRPPEGSLLEKLTPQPKHEIYRWKGPPGPDGRPTLLEVSLEPAPAADKKLEDVLEAAVEAVPRKGLIGWTCTAAERGELKGITFARVKWTIVSSPFKLKTSGYEYAAVDGDTLVRISGSAAAPAGAGALDAAPLTFRRAPAK